MIITLLSDRLSFVRTATGTIHSCDAKWTHATLHPLTMCGKEIPENAPRLQEKTAKSDQMCKRCLASLRTYTGGAKRLYATPLVRFDESEAKR